MHIKIAAYSGFCYGVRRAVKIVEELLDEARSPVYSLGPIIHNMQAVERLSSKGLRVIDSLEGITAGTVIIRAHGARPEIYHDLTARGVHYVDTTCPFVRNSQTLAQQLVAEGYQLIILGDIKHPEIISIMGYSEDKGQVVRQVEELDQCLDMAGRKIGCIAQTTQITENFRALVSGCIERGGYEVRAFDTICKDSCQRQETVRTLSATCDCMLVVGGGMSANTKKLALLCERSGAVTHHIEDVNDIDPHWFEGLTTVGIASGASTPDWVIEDIKGFFIARGDEIDEAAPAPLPEISDNN